jgi:hypothetical protein
MKGPSAMSQQVDRRTFCLMLAASSAYARAAAGNALTFSCSIDNDVYRAVTDGGANCRRVSNPSDAITAAEPGSGVLLLSDAYPDRPVLLPGELMKQAGAKNLRVYAEFASHTALSGNPRFAEWHRAVVTSPFFGRSLPALRILSAHQCQYLAIQPPAEATPHLVMARVAGFDTAVFGIPQKDVHALLFEEEGGRILTATTQLSRFITARYAPFTAWSTVWEAILSWVVRAESPIRLKASPDVRPAYPAVVRLPDDGERRAFSRGVDWYRQAHLFIHPSWAHKLDEAGQYSDRVGPAPTNDLPVGDGSLGMLEGHSSGVLPSGSQHMRWYIRADCVGETAMVYSLAHRVNGKAEDGRIASNLLDFLMFHSKMTSGSRMDPDSPSYGLIGWNEASKYHDDMDGYDVYYGDDNARCLLGVLATMATSREFRWQERFWLAVLANFRLVGTNGHLVARIDQKPLQANGWKHYAQASTVLHDMNYEAYPWALFLWAFANTGYQPFLAKVLKGVSLTMEAYPARWRWADSFTAHQARILLPLAWLVRVHDTTETRSWLNRVATDLLDRQHSSGAIREWTGERSAGIQMAPASNDEYGTGEGPVIQNNGDPASDLLYTMNFAFIGLHEAYAATNQKLYQAAEDRIAEFLVRAQVCSKRHREFDGAWFRAFDFDKWDYWASNSDAGWGAWCTESGWSQSWISTVFALRLMKRSLWDVVSAVPKYTAFDRLRDGMSLL